MISCEDVACVSRVFLSGHLFVFFSWVKKSHVFVCVPDECEEVEQQVQKVVQEMENILGEPLQSYF